MFITSGPSDASRDDQERAQPNALAGEADQYELPNIQTPNFFLEWPLNSPGRSEMFSWQPSVSALLSGSHNLTDLGGAPQNGDLVPNNAENAPIAPVAEPVAVVHTIPENFDKLYVVAEKLWFGEFRKEDLRTISQVEDDVLKLLIASKAPAENLDDAFADKAQGVVLKCSKRLEEKRKFVVKRVVTKMVNNYHRLDKGSRRTGKIQNHLNFLKKYFGGAARSSGIAIEGFLLPDLPLEHPDKLKIINEEYIRRVRMSPQFVDDFCATMNELSKEEMKSEIRGKLKKFVESLYSSYSQDGSLEALKQRLDSDKAKQPWTLFEAEVACRSVRDSLLKHA